MRPLPDMPRGAPRMPADALDALPPCVGTCPPSWPADRLPEAGRPLPSPAVTVITEGCSYCEHPWQAGSSTTSGMVPLDHERGPAKGITSSYTPSRVCAREQAGWTASRTWPVVPLGGPWTHCRACPRSSMPDTHAEARRRASGGFPAGAPVLPPDGTPRPCPAGSADVPASEPEAQAPVPTGLLPDGSGELPPKLPPFFCAVPAGYPQAMGWLPVR